MLPSPNRLAFLEAGGRVLRHFSGFLPSFLSIRSYEELRGKGKEEVATRERKYKDRRWAGKKFFLGHSPPPERGNIFLKLP